MIGTIEIEEKETTPGGSWAGTSAASSWQRSMPPVGRARWSLPRRSRPPPRWLTMHTQAPLGPVLPSSLRRRDGDSARSAAAVGQTRPTPSITWRASRRISSTVAPWVAYTVSSKPRLGGQDPRMAMNEAGSIAAFLGGVGAGSVVTAVVQHYLGRKAQKDDVLQQEKREVFNGLLSSLEALEVGHSVENAKRFGFWAARAEIVASRAVLDSLERFRATEPNTPPRSEALREMLRTMRIDRGVQ